jgi:hypothetical protein
MHREIINCSKAHYRSGEWKFKRGTIFFSRDLQQEQLAGSQGELVRRGTFPECVFTEAAAVPELSVESAEPNDCGF